MSAARHPERTGTCTGPARALAWWLLVVLSVACARSAGQAESGFVPAPTPAREGRFGSLRDFVLIERPAAAADEGERGPTYFFLDRFEVTRGDWAMFAGSPAGERVAATDAALGGDLTLPVGRVDLRQARAFARWRFARLPRLEEWQIATVGGGRNTFPWGSNEGVARANAGELGLGEPTPVGTFESGRRADGMPYDLIGNVSEWTETVPWSWCLADGAFEADPRTPASGAAVDWLQRRVLRAPGLAVWQGPGGLLPLACAVALGGPDVPHEVAGSDFLTPMSQQTESVLAGDRRLRTGVRLCTTPVELLRALLATDYEPTAVDMEQLRRFVLRGRHAEVLRAAWAQLAPQAEAAELASSLGQWLAAHLGAAKLPGGAR